MPLVTLREHCSKEVCVFIICDCFSRILFQFTQGKHSLALVPGGATEALYAGNGRHTLKLKNRLGFIRLAMQSGIDVVPVYTFGENNTYDVLDAKYESK